MSFVYQNIAGRPWESLYQAGGDRIEAAAIAAQIGHPLVDGPKRIQLFPAGNGTAGVDRFNVTGSEFYEGRLTQLDLRFTKIFQLGGARIRGWFDVFNIFNESAATNLVANYSSPTLPYPAVASVMGGRLFKLGAQFDF